jgi:hypothetical protein
MLAFLSQMYWGVAIFASVLFVWQLIAAIFGHIGGGEHIETGGGHDITVGGHDVAGAEHGTAETAVQAAESVASFKLLSVRSATAFCLMFGWAGVLYSQEETPPSDSRTILISLMWGLGGMVVVSLIFYFLARMTETGNRRLVTSLGQRGTVYMDIPAGGTGQVRAVVSGQVSLVAARSAGGEALKSGTEVVVKRMVDASTVEVEKA